MKKALFIAICATLLLATGVTQEESAAPASHAGRVGLPVDWSHRSVIHRTQEVPSVSDPRAVYQWLQNSRWQAIARESAASGARGLGLRGKVPVPRPAAPKFDWSLSLSDTTLA